MTARHIEAERDPELVDMARWLHLNADGRPYSLRKITSELVDYGYKTPSGKRYAAAAVLNGTQLSLTPLTAPPAPRHLVGK